MALPYNSTLNAHGSLASKVVGYGRKFEKRVVDKRKVSAETFTIAALFYGNFR